MTSPPPPTWHTLTPSHSEAEAWALSLYETLATHRSLMDAHTVDFFTCSHWDNVVPKRWKEELKDSEFFADDDNDDDLIFPTSPSTDPGSLHHYLYTARSHSIPMVWGGGGAVSVPDHHLARFGMTTKKSHEVDNFSRFVSQLTSKLSVTQVLDVGSGKGYLSQHLALGHRLCVVGIDAQVSNTQGAITRNEKVYKAWRCVSNPHKLCHNPKQHIQPSTSYTVKDNLATGSPDSKLNLSSLFNEEELPANYEKEKEREEKKMYDCGKTELSFESLEDEKSTEEMVDKSDEQKLNPPSSSERRKDVFSHDDQGLPESSNSVSDMKNVSQNFVTPQESTHGKCPNYKFDVKHLNSRVSATLTDGVSFTPLTQTISLATIGEDETPVSSQTRGQGSIMEAAERESGGKFVSQGPTCLVGLHTCGDLGGVALKLFLRQPQLRAVCVVGCCYHHITEKTATGGCCKDDGFPMSQFLQSQGAFIGRTGRMLACQAASRISLVSSGAALESVFRRAVLQVLLKRRYPDVLAARGKTLVVGRMRKAPPSFEEYVTQSLKKLDLDTTRVPGEEAVAVYREFESERQHLSIHLKLRAVLASCVESLILMDRLVFLHEQESMGDISLVQLFDPAVSPRCFAVTATKKTL